MPNSSKKFVADTPAALKVDNSQASGEPIDFGLGDEVAAGAAERDSDAVDAAVAEALGNWEELMGPLVDQLDELVAGAASLDELREILATGAGDVIAKMDTSAIAELVARMGLSAKVAGLLEVPGR